MSIPVSVSTEALPLPGTGSAPRRIPSFDGLRGLCIAAVIAAHIAGSGSVPFSHGVFGLLEKFGHFGVRIFFVISGFLTTLLVIRERAETGCFSLKNYYWRRAWRILPPAYGFILCLWIANRVGWISIPPFDFLRSLVYVMNYGPMPNWNLGHLWSLSVEEQFYLVWPFILAFLSLRNSRYIAVLFILVSSFLRYYVMCQSPKELWRIEYQFQFAGTAIAFGCLLAIDQSRMNAQRWFRWLCASRYTIPLTSLVIVGNATLLRTSGPRGACVSDVITNLAICIILARVSSPHFNGFGAKVLNSRPVVFVGLISYSLYLWQQVFTNSDVHGWTAWFPYNLLLIFVFGICFYYVVEKPSRTCRLAFRYRPSKSKVRVATEIMPRTEMIPST